MKDSIKLSVVIPAYNEAKNLKSGVLDQVYDYLKKQKYTYEVLIVDDGSSDGTIGVANQQIKNKPNFKVIKKEHSGKALTVVKGMLEAKGNIVLFTDMDQATPLNQVEKLLPKFDQGYEVVIGVRGGRKGAPLIRKITAWGFSFLRNIILGLPLSDTQCGFKAFNQKASQIVFSKMEELRGSNIAAGAALNAGFDVEMLYFAKKQGFKITEVPVFWQYVGTERFRLIGDAVEALTDMFKIRWYDLNGRYSKPS